MSDRRFPQSIRLRRSADYRKVQRRGARIRSRHLVVCWLRTGDSPRFGLTVSRRVGNAVVRNRVKRWLREAIRHERAGLTDVDVVFIARSAAGDAGFEAIRSEVDAALGRIRSQV